MKTSSSGKNIKVTYEETYKDAFLVRDKLPTLNHLAEGPFTVVSTELLKAGNLEDGSEFQVLRVIIKEG